MGELRQFRINVNPVGGCACHPEILEELRGYYHAYRNIAGCFFEVFGRYAWRMEKDHTASLLVEDMKNRHDAVDKSIANLKDRAFYLSFDLLSFEEVPVALSFDDFVERYETIFDEEEMAKRKDGIISYKGKKRF